MHRCSNPACWNLISQNSAKKVSITGVLYCSMECYQTHKRDSERLTRMSNPFWVNPRKEAKQLMMNFGTGESDECSCRECTDP